VGGSFSRREERGENIYGAFASFSLSFRKTYDDDDDKRTSVSEVLTVRRPPFGLGQKTERGRTLNPSYASQLNALLGTNVTTLGVSPLMKPL
jgi:hypothetical protein